MEDGNNNVPIAAVAQEISSIARDANVAALLLHHLRKSSTGTIDDLMGATSLRANFRNVRIHAGMSMEEALQFGIPSAEAWRFFYVSGSKENYAPPFMDRVWFEKVSVKLDNPAGIYTEGDEVGAVVRWTPQRCSRTWTTTSCARCSTPSLPSRTARSNRPRRSTGSASR